MDALISGQIGTAVCIDGEQIYSFDWDNPDQPIERNDWEIPLIFRDAPDVVRLRNISGDEVLPQLKTAWKKDRSLQLILILLGAEEDADTILMAAECLDEFLLDQEVVNYVADRLYSAALPDEMDFGRAQSLAETQHLYMVLSFLKQLWSDQDEIIRRSQAWEALSSRLFDSPEEKRVMRAKLITHGAFRLFVEQRQKRDLTLVQLLVHPAFRGNARWRNILQAWAAPFRGMRNANSPLISDREDTHENDALPGRRHSSNRVVARRSHYGIPANLHAVMESVERQKAEIKKDFVAGNDFRAWRFVDQLVLRQRKESRPTDLAKSLCDLAQFAKDDLNSPELQFRLASRATEEAPSDAWAFSVLGDALRGLGRYPEAIKAYDTVSALGDERISLLGHAEIFKDIGNLESCLQFYRECLDKYPLDLVARNGEAAALSHFGRLNEALQAYDIILEDQLFDAVTNAGRAQVLREMGELQKALAELDVVVESYPDSRVAQHERGEVLRELGKSEEALRAFSDIQKRFPNNIMAHLSYAKVLRDQGQFDAAIREFTRIKETHRFNPLGSMGLADTYKRLGNTQAAISLYDEVLRHFPRMISARNGKAAILASKGKYEEALDLLPKHLPALLSEWVAYHIRGMIYMRSGDYEKAQAVFDWGIENNPWATQRNYFLAAMASLRVQQKRYEEVAPLTMGITNPSVKPISHILTLHALGALKDNTSFQTLFKASEAATAPIVRELRGEIDRRYFSRDTRAKTEDWIIQREWDTLLFAA